MFCSLPKGSSLGFRTEVQAVAEQRKHEIARFLDSLFTRNISISQSDLVYTFFHPLLRDQQEADIHLRKLRGEFKRWKFWAMVIFVGPKWSQGTIYRNAHARKVLGNYGRSDIFMLNSWLILVRISVFYVISRPGKKVGRSKDYLDEEVLMAGNSKIQLPTLLFSQCFWFFRRNLRVIETICSCRFHDIAIVAWWLLRV